VRVGDTLLGPDYEVRRVLRVVRGPPAKDSAPTPPPLRCAEYEELPRPTGTPPRRRARSHQSMYSPPVGTHQRCADFRALRSPPATPTKPKPKPKHSPKMWLDTAAFPHILDAVVKFAPYEALVGLRGTCRAVKRAADARIAPMPVRNVGLRALFRRLCVPRPERRWTGSVPPRHQIRAILERDEQRQRQLADARQQRR
jgi:hypothetical protein